MHRCFFLHLGVALGLHPIALQAVFRTHAQVLLQYIEAAPTTKLNEDDNRFDELKQCDSSLRSVLNHNALIEAPVLSVLWPQELLELQRVRVLIYTVGPDGPQPHTCYLFSPNESSAEGVPFDGIDVILKLQGMHFTLLQPKTDDAAGSVVVERLLCNHHGQLAVAVAEAALVLRLQIARKSLRPAAQSS